MNQYFTAVNSFSSLFKPVHSLINTANFRSRIEYFPTEIQFLLHQRKNSLLSISQTRSLYLVDIIVTIDVWLIHIPFRQVHHFLIPKRLIIPEVRVLCHACISQKMTLTRRGSSFLRSRGGWFDNEYEDGTSFRIRCRLFGAFGMRWPNIRNKLT